MTQCMHKGKYSSARLALLILTTEHLTQKLADGQIDAEKQRTKNSQSTSSNTHRRLLKCTLSKLKTDGWIAQPPRKRE